jgi:hypothetical protein
MRMSCGVFVFVECRLFADCLCEGLPDAVMLVVLLPVPAMRLCSVCRVASCWWQASVTRWQQRWCRFPALSYFGNLYIGVHFMSIRSGKTTGHGVRIGFATVPWNPCVSSACFVSFWRRSCASLPPRMQRLFWSVIKMCPSAAAVRGGCGQRHWQSLCREVCMAGVF